MALPRQTAIKIEYNGSVKESSVLNESTESSGVDDITTASKEDVSSVSYTVVKGDSLWSIANRFLGSGTRYIDIYNANIDIIESTARAHGKQNASNGGTKGWWIWAGEILKIPSAEQEKSDGSNSYLMEDTVSDEENSGLSEKIEKQITALTYTDVASGQSDEIELTMYDIEKEWMGSCMPEKGADIAVTIIRTDGDDAVAFECGKFILDDISFSGRPTTCVLGGVSVPALDDFKSCTRTKTWEKVTIQEIADQIAQSAGVKLYYDAETIQIEEIEQSGQTDSSFLYSLCEKYGLAMKVYNHKIVIFDIAAYEDKEAVDTIDEEDMTKWSYNTTICGTYTGVMLCYTDPDSEDTLNVTIGQEGRMYVLNTQASSRYDAELQAIAKFNEANRNIETMSITIPAKVGLVASQCINISSIGEEVDGKYYIEKIQHSIGEKGYTMQMSLHKVQTRIENSAEKQKLGGGQVYTVVKGDSLWSIANRFLGSGTRYIDIYNANIDIIESTARAHGKQNASNGGTKGWWIWAGETLTIPEV